MSQSIQPQVRTINGLSIRYAESEPRQDHALLFSPWPESIYAYEPTWSRLAKRTHLVAIDLPGFGKSEAALYPGRVRSLVAGTGGTAVPLQLGGVLKEWVEAPSLDPYRKIDGRQIVTAAISTLERYKPTDVARQDYISSFEGERFAESMRYVRAALVTSWWAGGYVKVGSMSRQ